MQLDGAVIRCPAPVGDLADDLTEDLTDGRRAGLAGELTECLPEAPHSGVLWRARRGRLLLEIPEVARYLVSDGNLVQIEPCPESSAAEVSRFLRMTPAAALHLQRGIPVLQAAVAADAAGRAVVLAGASGAGKSVLLDELLQRGWGLLGDDLAPVTLNADRVPVALPTGPQVILWPDSLGQRAGPAATGDPPGLATTGLPGLRRTVVTCDDRYVGEARPISAIWWLSAHSFDPIEIRGVHGAARFDALGALAYHRRIAGALLDRASYLAIAGAVAGAAIPIRRLIRPRGRWTAAELADIVSAASQGSELRPQQRGQVSPSPSNQRRNLPVISPLSSTCR